MEQLENILKTWVDKELGQIVLSNPRNPQQAVKIKIRPILLKEELYFQQTLYRGTQVFHSNYEKDQMVEEILRRMAEDFRQGEVQSARGNVTILVSKKGKVTVSVKEKADARKGGAQEHNRTKRYILEEGIPVPFLVDLGIQTREGKTLHSRYDKFRQINRYLEFIEDILPKLPGGRTLRIIDFGCGKSYLTFAMYHYLHTMKQYPVQITGLDLKEDVIRGCNALAEKYGYRDLHFEIGDISTYEGADRVDMVVTLHACDTATDYALEKAIKWGAEVILAVPCCQHEVNRQLSCEQLAPILKYGLIRERMAALVTDAVRAQVLEQMGYDTQILEFIDMEHTPKNILIRGVKRKGMQPRGKQTQQLEAHQLQAACSYLHVQTTLQRLLADWGQE